MLNSVGSALGFIFITFLTSTVSFTVLVFGVMLRRKILLWDDQWRERVVASGTTMDEYADDLERTYEKVRGSFRLLGFFLVVIVLLMGVVAFLGIQEHPLLGSTQTSTSLWLLSLVALAIILPAFINFAVGTYLAETMMLKAGAFAFLDAKDDMREKRMKQKMMEKAKELKSKWATARGQGTQTVQAEAAKPEAEEAGKPGPEGGKQGAGKPAAKK